MSGFWRAWLTVWCVAVGAFGALLAAGAFEATRAPVVLLYTLLGGAPPMFDPALAFSVGLMGAVTIGWSLTFYAAFEAAHALGAQSARIWRLITVSVFAWYVIDGAISALTGYALNIASNTVLLIGYLIPLMAGRARAPA
jgi:hypothetical protein